MVRIGRGVLGQQARQTADEPQQQNQGQGQQQRPEGRGQGAWPEAWPGQLTLAIEPPEFAQFQAGGRNHRRQIAPQQLPGVGVRGRQTWARWRSPSLGLWHAIRPQRRT
jgi:hypothetical protein